MGTEIIIGVAIMVGLGLLFSSILAIAYKKLRVEEDPRIDEIEEMLPHANCGACGVPGCRVFAEKLVGKELAPSKCTVSSPAQIAKIAKFLGVDPGKQEKRVARLLCAGGKKEAHNLSEYHGSMRTCRAESVVSEGPKACSYGCLGLADCVEVCDFDAIHMNENGLPVVTPELCTACNDCVDICPKELFEIMPISQKLIVQCKSLLDGEEAESLCSVACTACGRCVSDAPEGLISIDNNLAIIDYNNNNLASPEAIWRCPTNAIVWLEGKQFDALPDPFLPLGRVENYPEIEYDE